MKQEVLKALEEELAELDMKASTLRYTIELFRQGGGRGPVPFAPAVPVARVPARAGAAGSEPPKTRTGSNVETARRVARELCSTSLDPVPTMDIVRELEKQGVTIGGFMPQNVVSSILSRTHEFQSNGRSGWTLNENGASTDAVDAPKAAPNGL